MPTRMVEIDEELLLQLPLLLRLLEGHRAQLKLQLGRLEALQETLEGWARAVPTAAQDAQLEAEVRTMESRLPGAVSNRR